MFEALSFEFMQNALAAALLASVACGVIGSLVVVNRLVFLAGGVAHTAYGGVGLAFATGLPVLPCTIGVTLGASAIMAQVTRRSRNRTDAIIGAMWAAGMAMGILLIDLTPGYAADLMSYLFGSILAVPRSDVWVMLALDTVIILSVLRFYRQFLAMSLDPEFAEARGVNVRALHFLLLALTAVSVVMVIRVVGLVLVMALITIPPFMAEPLTRTLGRMMALASALAALFSVIGLALSYMLDVTAGAAIIGVASVAFFVSLPLRGRSQ